MTGSERLSGRLMPALRLAERGLDVSVIEWAGPAGAPTALLVHANSLCAAAWENTARALQARYRVLAYDLRGHGETKFVPGEQASFQWAEIGADLAAVSAALGPIEFCVTHSFSGSCALLGSATNPRIWKKLAMIDPVLLPFDPTTAAKIAEATRTSAPRRFASFEEAAVKLRRNWLFERWEDSALELFLRFGFRSIEGAAGGIEPRCSRDDEASVYAARVGGEALMEAARSIDTPICVLWAEERRPNESPRAIDFGRELVQQRSNRSLVMLPGYRHFAPMESDQPSGPNQVSALLLDFGAAVA